MSYNRSTESVCIRVFDSDLGWPHVFLFEQRITERLLLPLIDVGESHHLFSVRRGKVKEGVIHRHKSLILPSDEQDTVSERMKEHISQIRGSTEETLKRFQHVSLQFGSLK